VKEEEVNIEGNESAEKRSPQERGFFCAEKFSHYELSRFRDEEGGWVKRTSGVPNMNI
jgi:hypothetical protein